MLTFKDLKFEPHFGGTGVQARLEFDNGYGVSVVQGPYFYTDTDDEYELAVLKDGWLCYDTSITNDVLGHLSKSAVTRIMKKIQQL